MRRANTLRRCRLPGDGESVLSGEMPDTRAEAGPSDWERPEAAGAGCDAPHIFEVSAGVLSVWLSISNGGRLAAAPAVGLLIFEPDTTRTVLRNAICGLGLAGSRPRARQILPGGQPEGQNTLRAPAGLGACRCLRCSVPPPHFARSLSRLHSRLLGRRGEACFLNKKGGA